MLGLGCLRALSENDFHPLSLVSTMGFVDLLKWVRKWVKRGFLGANVVELGQRPLFPSFGTILGHWQKQIKTHNSPNRMLDSIKHKLVFDI